ncbi:MAG: sulfotransferase [Bacteroidales bacterium]
MKSPLIIISAPHSGASLLSGILHRAGIFMGEDQKEGTSQFFSSVNCWLFFQAGATWDNPYNFRFIETDFREETGRAVKRQLKGRSFGKYLGKLHRKTGSYKKIDFDWGWYAPLNAYTWEIWKTFFEDAVIIHFLRNPVDVAAGMKREAEAGKMQKGLFSGIKRRGIENRLQYTQLYGLSQRVLNLYEGFKLWQEYINRIGEIEDNHSGPFITIRYENLLQEPERSLHALFDKLNFRLPAGIIDNAILQIDRSQAWAFAQNKSLMEFYHTIKDHSMVVEQGYHKMNR